MEKEKCSCKDIESTCSCEECECTEENNCECTDNCGCHDEAGCSCEECECTEENNCGCTDNCDCHDEVGCSCEECECTEEKEIKKEKKKLFGKKEKIESKMEELKSLIKEHEDKELRIMAEFVNFKKRREDEVSKMLKFANEDIVKDLLPVIDNFNRALEVNSDDEKINNFLSGFKMINDNLVNTLNKYGVEEIDALNKEFDPQIHQAVLTEEVDGVDSNIVVEVLQKGYKLKDKVIRPTMVKVSQ